jgi:hypothetical protein
VATPVSAIVRLRITEPGPISDLILERIGEHAEVDRSDQSIVRVTLPAARLDNAESWISALLDKASKSMHEVVDWREVITIVRVVEEADEED